jgi:hypothetical protein
MQYLSGGRDIRVFRKPAKDSWGDLEPQYLLTLEDVGIAPRTTKTSEGEGFRGRVQSGYTIYLDQWQVEQLREDDEFEIVMNDGTAMFFGLDGSLWGGQWNNPLSFWQPGFEVNLRYLHHARVEEP